MPGEPRITIGSSDYAPQTTALASSCFVDDPAFVYWLNDRPREWRVAFQPRLFTTIIRCAALCNNHFLEANEWQSYVVLTQPDVDPESTIVGIRAGWAGCFWTIGWAGFKRINWNYIDTFKTARKRHLGSASHYFIFSCGTHEDHRRKGLVTALLRECIKIAQSTGHPVWSEATTAGSRDAHLKAGFEVVEEVMLGAGECNKAGEARQGGEGVKMFALVWRPKVRQENSVT